MVFRREAAARLLETGEKRTYQITCRQCRGARDHWDWSHWSHWGTEKLISFCFLMASSYFGWLAGGGLKSDIFIFIILQELKSKSGQWPDIFSKYFQSCIVAVSVL